MEASGQRSKPAWMPSAVNADALRDMLRGLKDVKLDSPAEAAASLPTPPFEERPELYVGAAFAGGLVLAGFVRLLGR